MTVRAAVHESGETFATDVRVCRTWVERLTGLLGTASLRPDQAVWIHHCNSIHTFFMAMTIDVAFLDGDQRVVKTIHALPPWRLVFTVPGARSVVEGPVGMLERGALEPGRRIVFTDDRA